MEPHACALVQSLRECEVQGLARGTPRLQLCEDSAGIAYIGDAHILPRRLPHDGVSLHAVELFSLQHRHDALRVGACVKASK